MHIYICVYVHINMYIYYDIIICNINILEGFTEEEIKGLEKRISKDVPFN